MSDKGIGTGICDKHGEYPKDASDSPCPSCEDEEGDREPSWRDKHSVGCYFCGVEFDEREGQDADRFNNNDGGSICPDCLKKFPNAEEEEEE